VAILEKVLVSLMVLFVRNIIFPVFSLLPIQWVKKNTSSNSGNGDHHNTHSRYKPCSLFTVSLNFNEALKRGKDQQISCQTRIDNKCISIITTRMQRPNSPDTSRSLLPCYRPPRYGTPNLPVLHSYPCNDKSPHLHPDSLAVPSLCRTR